MKDLNPHKKDSNPIYKIKLLFEDQAQGFKSLSFGFESPFDDELKLHKKFESSSFEFESLLHAFNA